MPLTYNYLTKEVDQRNNLNHRQNQNMVAARLKVKKMEKSVKTNVLRSIMIIKKYPNADFYSMINMVDGAYAYEQANVNLSLNALGLIFDMHSCLKIDNTKLFNH